MRQPPRDGVAGDALGPTPPAPSVVVDDPTLQHRTVGLEALPDHDKAEFVEAAERRQVRARKSRVGHVEVFQRMVSVGTSILRETSTL
jgi:hypothetical protein